MAVVKSELTPAEAARLEKIMRAWDFYEGYHWESIDPHEGAEVTINYCRAFVNKFVSFELGSAFTFSTHEAMKDKIVSTDRPHRNKETGEMRQGRTLFEYLEDVWEDNNQYIFVTEIGQMKSVTGESWVQVHFMSKEELDEEGLDPYDEYPKGRLELIMYPSGAVFPTFNPKRKDQLVSLKIAYQYDTIPDEPNLKVATSQTVAFKQVWTREYILTKDGKSEEQEVENPYGFIPFVQIKNIFLANQNTGTSDLDDIIPMNVEYNQKLSNMSDILDYHAAPITLVYGARIGSLEKGANKLWGGLAKDAKVENLELKGDQTASNVYTANLKLAMCEVGGIPQTVLGGSAAISNTSGVALQYLNLPLIEKTRLKRASTEDGLERLNKMIILVSVEEGLISSPEELGVTPRDFFHTEVSLPDTLPKDEVLQLQALQTELQMGLTTRKRALQRLGREDIDQTLKEVEEDMKSHPTFYGLEPPMEQPQLNSGFTNGQTPIETVRKAVSGENKPLPGEK
jgi:hypothetical protein